MAEGSRTAARASQLVGHVRLRKPRPDVDVRRGHDAIPGHFGTSSIDDVFALGDVQSSLCA